MPTQKEELQLNTQQDMSSEDMYVLKKLFTEYVSLYRLELNSGKYEILRLIANTNAKQIVGEEYRWDSVSTIIRKWGQSGFRRSGFLSICRKTAR